MLFIPLSTSFSALRQLVLTDPSEPYFSDPMTFIEGTAQSGDLSMPSKRKQPQQFQGYQLVVSKWEIGFSSSQMPEDPRKEYLDLALDVKLSSPIKGVTAGHITLFGSMNQCGGYLKYNIDKTLYGALWIGIPGASVLVTVLTSGKQIILFLYGKPFRYRSAAIRDVSWYTMEHPSIEESE